MKLFRRSRTTPELRRCYRRPPGVAIGVELEHRGAHVESRCTTDLCADGIGLDLEPGGDAYLPDNLEHKVLRLHLHLPRRQKVLTTEAMVVRDSVHDLGRHLGVRFRDRERLAGLLEPHEFRLFNRRHEQRVPPHPSERLPLTLDPDGLAIRVLARNISRDGIGFSVDEAGRAALLRRDEWVALLRLPGTSRPVRVLLEIRHRTAVARGQQVGAVFREERRRVHALLRAEVGDFVGMRRIQLARWDSWVE